MSVYSFFPIIIIIIIIMEEEEESSIIFILLSFVCKIKEVNKGKLGKITVNLAF